ncbi:4-hydroxy-tetrahydrodipicolinate synthase [Flavobacteriaceae bacterium Ap0902]|nr:4-hydroxy-tetrahydrodipicolinate synthase [Flavobacteriaceae bacterium Ap0902]
MHKFKGTGVALVTPFNADKEVDLKGIENLVNHSIDGGVEFLVLMGTTAESATLDADEKIKAIDKIKEVNNSRVPMVIGIGGNDTRKVSKQIASFDLNDFDAVLSVSPAYNKPTQEGIYQHFKAISESTDKSIILYNVPSRTASNMLPETTIRLAQDFENIVAIKEASPSFVQSTEIIKNKPEGFSVLSGDDEFALPMTLAGGDGVISVIGQAIPAYSEMIRLALDRKVDAAYEIHYRLMDLIRSIYIEGNPVGIKALLEIQEVCTRTTRLPLVKATDHLTQQIERLYAQTK